MKRRTTGIEWTDHTWNPFLGCSIKSAGCHNCYAMALAYRLSAMGNSFYDGLTKVVKGKTIWTGKVNLNSDRVLKKPTTITEPSIFFVNSMSDFFHVNATDEMRLNALKIMEDTPRHQYQILTKRPENVIEFIKRTRYKFSDNVWLGATVENYSVIDRIALVRNFPARIKFLSVEPLIGPLGKNVNLSGIDWVITGGESGPGARPCEVDWLREVRDSCLKFRVSHFFKQWGIASNNPIFKEAVKARDQMKSKESPLAVLERLDPIGKGGSLLDGKSWKEMPGDFEVANFGKTQEFDFK